MSLMVGTGPFGRLGGTLVASSDGTHHLYWEPYPRRLRAVVDGETVIDTRDAMLLHETGRLPAHWFRMEDLPADRMEPSETSRHDEHKGDDRRWHLRVGDRLVEDAVRTHEDPPEELSFLRGWATVPFAAADRWFEEDDPIYAHPKDPYHRVDVRAGHRHVVVRHGGTVVAETERPRLLFETGIPVRFYVPFADVRIELLTLSDTVSECPYKGDGQHWHLDVDGDRVEDVGWSLPHPLPEAFTAAEHVSFYMDKVEVEVDGERLAEPDLF